MAKHVNGPGAPPGQGLQEDSAFNYVDLLAYMLQRRGAVIRLVTRLREYDGYETEHIDWPANAVSLGTGPDAAATEATIIIVAQELWAKGFAERSLKVSQYDSSEYEVTYTLRRFYYDSPTGHVVTNKPVKPPNGAYNHVHP